MEPLSCLAIAGALVQFLDFGAKLVKEAYALYEDGESTIRKKAATDAGDLQDFSAKFGQALRQKAEQNALSEDEKTLRSLCLDCKRIADSLAAKLETLNVREKNRVWKSLGTALSNVWSKSEIQKMDEDLNKYRRAIDTRVMSLTRDAVIAMASQQSARFNSLDLETRQIATALTGLKSTMESDLKIRRVALAQLLNRQEAVVKLNANTRTVISVYNANSNLDLKSDDTIQDACDKVRSGEDRVRKSISSAVLESLRFHMMVQRFEDVTEAHHDTFQWIFQHPHEDIQGRQWDDFVEWLETGNGLYWISGKAGSGKSTLLKMISHHQLLLKHLSVWKQHFDLYTAKFFFWSSGTMLQRSQEGMLRSLLYDVLLQTPQLIPFLFPTEWAELYLQKLRLPDSNLVSYHYSPISLSDVQSGATTYHTLDLFLELDSSKGAFEIPLGQNIVPMRLCLFVDGLDEYSGLSSQIADIFHKAIKAPQVKVCVSSRPLFAFEESFVTQPQLRVEDLTKGDIKKYIVDMLENDDKMQKRICKEPDQMRDLGDEIVQSASGVFLWVRLIVMDLLRGLENHDKVSQLQERLRLLPTDLEELYEHMVFKVDRIYRVEASRFYQIIAAAAEQDDDWRPALNLTIMNLFLAEEDDDLIFKTELGWLSNGTIHRGIWETDLRLRSRCGGLLETRFGKLSLRETQPEMPISYIHRTVKDYLDGTGIRHILSDRTGGLCAGSFNPNLALMRAYILHLKATEAITTNFERAEELMDAFFTHARRADVDLCSPNTELVDEFLLTRKSWLQAAGLREREAEASNEDGATLAIKTGLPNYLRVLLADDLVNVDGQMLNHALCQPPRCEQFVNKEIINLLLEYGADPNETPTEISEKRANNQSPWQNAITFLATKFLTLPEKRRKALTMRWHGIIKLLLQHGAKPNTICAGPIEITREEETGKRKVNETTRTPKQVVEELYRKYPRELVGLIKLLDSKGATKMPEDDVGERMRGSSPPKKAKGEAPIGDLLQDKQTELPLLIAAEDLTQMVMQEAKEAAKPPQTNESSSNKLKGRFDRWLAGKKRPS